MPIKTRIDGNSKGIPYREERLNEVWDLEDWLQTKIGIHPSIEQLANDPVKYTPEVIETRYGDNSFYFFILLAAGKEKAAGYLSDCYTRDIGTNANKTNDFHFELPFIVGSKLGDKKCKEIMEDETPTDQRLEPCAAACTSSILRNKAELGTHATFKDIIGRAKLLDQQIEQMSGESYFKTMTDEVWLSYVNDVEVIVTSDDVVMSGQSPEACCIIM